MSAARDGDIAEVENVLKASPKTAKFCSFGVRISPLHFAAAKGHREVSLGAVRFASHIALNLTFVSFWLADCPAFAPAWCKPKPAKLHWAGDLNSRKKGSIDTNGSGLRIHSPYNVQVGAGRQAILS